MSSNKGVSLIRILHFVAAEGTRGSIWIKNFLRNSVDDSGAELFEFAIVVPLLLMILLGIIWIGRAYNIYETITRASREGARYAVLPNSVADGNAYPDPLTSSCSTDTNTFNDSVLPVLKSDNLDPTKVQNYCQMAGWLENTAPQQCGVTVRFGYPVHLDIPFTSFNLTTIDLVTQAQMRLENQPIDGTCP